MGYCTMTYVYLCSSKSEFSLLSLFLTFYTKFVLICNSQQLYSSGKTSRNLIYRLFYFLLQPKEAISSVFRRTFTVAFE